uniref:GRF zinc finger family protein n=3 Tax=Oryza TaxID=4527 RepID=Q2R0S0_ORYSJ|nr:GRF zinc finger family protein [Oryza sativa Japonica Group]
MASASSSSLSSRRNRLVLPLIVCPSCNVKTIVRCTAKTDANRGRVFYTCPDHEKDGSGCNFWYWEQGYINFLKRNGFIEDGTKGKSALRVDLEQDDFGRQDELEKNLIAVVPIARELLLAVKGMLVLGLFGVVILVLPPFFNR